MPFFFLCCVILILYSHQVVSDGVEEDPPMVQISVNEELQLSHFESMRTKDLRKYLADRGKSCKGCTEKHEFVTLAHSVQALAVQELEDKFPEGNGNGNAEDDSMGDIMEKLKRSGFGGNVFSASDFAGLSQEELKKKFESGAFGGGGGGGSPFRKPTKPTRSKKEREPRKSATPSASDDKDAEIIDL